MNLSIIDSAFTGKGFILDPDNVFWAAVRKGEDGKVIIPEKALSLYKKIKDGLDAQMADFRFSSNLTAIYIDPTDRCNADCPYCYVPAEMRRNGRSMSREELVSILQKAERYFKGQKRKAVIIFHASEPLLVKDVIFGAIEAYGEVFKFGLQTNAILLKKEDVKFLRAHRVGVGISLDSHLPVANDRSRRSWRSGGNYRKAIEAIEMFDGYDGLNVISTITKFNAEDLPGMVAFLHSKRVPCVLMNPVRLTRKSSHAVKPDEKVMTRYFIRAVDEAIRLSRRSDRRIIVGNFANIILGIVAPTARRLMCDISPCGGGRCFFTVTASGEMIPCGEFIGLKGFSGGNIFKDTIEKAMGSRPFKAIRSRIAEKIDKCRECDLRNLCGAPCPAELHAHGDMFKPSVFCEFYKAVIAHAFKLIMRGEEGYCFRKDAFDNLKYEYKLSTADIGGRA